jgi:hypothetical protein
MIGGAPSVLTPAQGRRAINRIVLQRRKRQGVEIGGHNLEGRTAAVQDEKRRAAASASMMRASPPRSSLVLIVSIPGFMFNSR